MLMSKNPLAHTQTSKKLGGGKEVATLEKLEIFGKDAALEGKAGAKLL